MKVTAQHKIYMGLLALAGGAFVVDRCFFTPPAANAKAIANVNGAPNRPAKKITPPTSAENADVLTDLSALSGRLTQATGDSIRDPSRPVDAFTASPSWIQRSNARGRKGQATPVEQFRAQHHLTAIMTGDKTAWVIVDGKTLGMGQSIAGFRLTQVGEHGATFESSDASVELSLTR